VVYCNTNFGGLLLHVCLQHRTYAQVRKVSWWVVWLQAWAHGWGELVLVQLYMHVRMYVWCVLNYGYTCWVDWYRSIYIWGYIHGEYLVYCFPYELWLLMISVEFLCNLETRFVCYVYIMWVWAAMKVLCRYTNSATCSSISCVYLRERMYATVYVARSLYFF
jgi:hypothetical protein